VLRIIISVGCMQLIVVMSDNEVFVKWFRGSRVYCVYAAVLCLFIYNFDLVYIFARCALVDVSFERSAIVICFDIVYMIVTRI